MDMALPEHKIFGGGDLHVTRKRVLIAACGFLCLRSASPLKEIATALCGCADNTLSHAAIASSYLRHGEID